MGLHAEEEDLRKVSVGPAASPRCVQQSCASWLRGVADRQLDELSSNRAGRFGTALRAEVNSNTVPTLRDRFYLLISEVLYLPKRNEEITK